MRDEQQPMLPPDSNKPHEVDASRRRFAKAGLGGSAVLITLASRPVLGATCLTPSAAGSGNHSQHNPAVCDGGLDPQWWIDNVVKNAQGEPRLGQKWVGTDYTPNQVFHPLFTAGTYLNMFRPNGNSLTFWQVLTGQFGNGNPINPQVAGPTGLAKWFVAGLLSASKNRYGGVIQPIGPDPSVRGIEDEFARNGFFQPTAGKQWNASTIIAYLQDPGSVF